MTRACVHFGTHNHPVKIGDYRKDIAKGRSLVKEQVHWTSMATNFDIVQDATEEMLGDMLIAPNGVQHRTLEIDKLLPLFDRCQQFSSASFRNKVSDFQYFGTSRIMDSITKL